MILPDETKTDYTIEEYLEMDQASEVRLEYSRGKVMAMAGGSRDHSLIASNTSRAIANQVNKNDKDCEVHNSELKIRIESHDKFRYPDGMVICDEPEYYNDLDSVVINPTLIIEVLSRSTAALDRGDKFHEYCSLPAFKEYLLIDQYKPVVDVLYREDKGSWKMTTTIGLDKSIRLNSLDIVIQMSDLYRKVNKLADPMS